MRAAASPYGCRITLPIALRPASTFKASAVCASGKVRSTCDEILPSAVHFTSFSRLARFLSGLSRAQCAPEHAADIATLQQRQIERHLRNIAGGKSDHQKAAFPRDRAQRCLGIAAADRVENNVGALAAGEPPQAFLEIFGGVVQAELGAMRFGEFKLFLRRCAGDHLEAHQLAEFACGQTRAAGGAEHRQGLARFRAGAIFQRMQRGAVNDDDAGGAIEIQIVGNFDDGIRPAARSSRARRYGRTMPPRDRRPSDR